MMGRLALPILAPTIIHQTLLHYLGIAVMLQEGDPGTDIVE